MPKQPKTQDTMYRIQLWEKGLDTKLDQPKGTYGNIVAWDMIGDTRLKLDFDHGGTDIVPLDAIGHIKVRNQ